MSCVETSVLSPLPHSHTRPLYCLHCHIRTRDLCIVSTATLQGMRIIHDPKDFDSLLAECRSESMKSFSDDKVMVEKFVSKPRYVRHYCMHVHIGVCMCTYVRISVCMYVCMHVDMLYTCVVVDVCVYVCVYF